MSIKSEIAAILATAFAEDVGSGDVTTNSIIDKSALGKFAIRTRSEIIFCGAEVIEQSFGAAAKILAKDGQSLKPGDTIAEINGNVVEILTSERVVLNLIQFLSAISTYTNKFAAEIAHTKAKIYDTRKTVPGLRVLSKYAVKCGGGENHRIGLYDMVMIKDNHIKAAGGITNAINKARATGLEIIIECDSLEQVKEAVQSKPNVILADNMTPDQLRQVVGIVAGKCKVEASGNINLDNIRAIAETGVDRISTSKITFAAPAVDIGLDELA